MTTTLNFFDSKVTENELHTGGVIRYANIGYVNDKPIDFVVKVVEGTSYTSTKASNRNGKSNGFGKINIEELRNNKGSSSSNGEGSFEFCLYDHENPDEKVTAESFRFAMYDLDERWGGMKEKITMDTTQIEDYTLSKDTEIDVSCDDGSAYSSSTDSLPCDAGVDTIFHSTTQGNGDDNPTDVNGLTELQKKRSMVFSFKDKSCFTMTLSHYCPVNKCRKYGGGNILFSGEADHLINEGECMPVIPKVCKGDDVEILMEDIMMDGSAVKIACSDIFNGFLCGMEAAADVCTSCGCVEPGATRNLHPSIPSP